MTAAGEIEAPVLAMSVSGVQDSVCSPAPPRSVAKAAQRSAKQKKSMFPLGDEWNTDTPGFLCEVSRLLLATHSQDTQSIPE